MRGERKGSGSILLHVFLQFSQHHLLSFFQGSWCCKEQNIPGCYKCLGFHLDPQFYFSGHLVVHQYVVVITTVALYWDLNLGIVVHLAMCLLYKIWGDGDQGLKLGDWKNADTKALLVTPVSDLLLYQGSNQACVCLPLE